MKIAGLQKHSMIDYPGNLSAIIFTAGCNFRCPFCHNPQLVLPELIHQQELIDTKQVLKYLEKNKTLLDALVISGGEPTLHKNLKDFIIQIKNLGLKIKLDTNGTNPDLLSDLIEEELIDYIAMDIKAPFETFKYNILCGLKDSDVLLENVKKSMHLLESKQIAHEYRTTVIKELLSPEDIQKIISSNSSKIYLQHYNNEVVIDHQIKQYNSYSESELVELIQNQSLGKDNIFIR